MRTDWSQIPAAASGLEAIDSLQIALFRSASQLAEAAQARRAEETRAHVAEVAELARTLFAQEERLLREARSLSLERHARQHERFLSDLEVVGEELERRGVGALAELQVANHVVAWLEAHVGQTDRDLDRAVTPTARA